jgi:putative molybdopterin biosynthesis protein
MQDAPGADTPLYLTTKEAADLLRVKERKVYDLAAEGDIPHRRITGKLLFPRQALIDWVNGDTGRGAERPDVVAGSHDPLLDWAIRESGCGLATLFDGSGDGLDRFVAGEAALTGLHVPDAQGWNIAAARARAPQDAVLVGWADRRRGLLLHHAVADRVQGLADLPGLRMALRQQGAGASALLDRLLDAAGLSVADLTATPAPARTESDAAAAVASGEAEVTLGLETMGRLYGLGFLPLTVESFDLLIDRRAYFLPPVQMLLAFARSAPFAAKAKTMAGYDLAPLGHIRWVSP